MTYKRIRSIGVITALLLVVSMFYGMIVLADNDNLALGKSVTYSGVEGGKVGEDWKYPQFTGEMVVDGDSNTRWSADKLDE